MRASGNHVGGAHGGWSKYGGGRGGSQSVTIDREWYCQKCGAKQAIGEIAFQHEKLVGEYIRICASCACEPK